MELSKGKKTIELIEMYRGSPCLWDPQHPEYKKNAVKNDARITVSVTVGCTAIGAKKKMESLMTSFRRTSESTSTVNLNNTLEHSSAPNSQQTVSAVSTESTQGTSTAVQAPRKRVVEDPRIQAAMQVTSSL
ncbi:hypothetical protein PR048_004512 [Dryococelus australis]|uniref:MADF domain-containing protein n=1 Tax=Dryococelus australis TaxID=614101 RepID=A0ABQ9I5N0_9NEOP|nr:hypothetical protein PR048_004512 [Dryococelus australis]